jgi:hypothetical protein
MRALILAVVAIATLTGTALAQRQPVCSTSCEPDGWGGQRCVTRCY